MGLVMEDALEQVLEDQWLFFLRYKNELLTLIQKIPVSGYSREIYTFVINNSEKKQQA